MLVDWSPCRAVCPKCGEHNCVEVRQVIRLEPPGGWSLSGVQEKYPGRVGWEYRCTQCGATGPADPKESPEEQARILSEAAQRALDDQ